MDNVQKHNNLINYYCLKSTVIQDLETIFEFLCKVIP
jgi:hypothetical protein